MVNNGTNDVNQNYRDMGFDFVDSGGHGGDFNAPWEAREECLKHSVGFSIVSFGISSVEVWWCHASWCHAVELKNLPALLLGK